MVDHKGSKEGFFKFIKFDLGKESFKRFLKFYAGMFAMIGLSLMVYLGYSYINMGRTISEQCFKNQNLTSEQCICAGSSMKNQVNIFEFIYMVVWERGSTEPESLGFRISEVATKECVSEVGG